MLIIKGAVITEHIAQKVESTDPSEIISLYSNWMNNVPHLGLSTLETIHEYYAKNKMIPIVGMISGNEDITWSHLQANQLKRIARLAFKNFPDAKAGPYLLEAKSHNQKDRIDYVYIPNAVSFWINPSTALIADDKFFGSSRELLADHADPQFPECSPLYFSQYPFQNNGESDA